MNKIREILKENKFISAFLVLLLGLILISILFLNRNHILNDNSTEKTNSQLNVIDWGVVVPSDSLKGTSQGVYEKVKINEEEKLYTEINKKVLNQKEIELFGFTEKQILEAQQKALRVTVNDVIDNPALNTSLPEYKDWVKGLNSKNYSEDLKKLMLESEPIVALNGDAILIPNFVYDTKPRLVNSEIKINSITASEYEKKPYLKFSLTSETDYRVDNQSLLDTVKKVTKITDKEELSTLLNKNVLAGEGESRFPTTSNIELSLQYSNEQQNWQVITVSVNYEVDEEAYKKQEPLD